MIWNSPDEPLREDRPLTIGQHHFESRLFVGTGKYDDLEVMQRALAESGTQCVTVAVRRLTLGVPAGHRRVFLDEGPAVAAALHALADAPDGTEAMAAAIQSRSSSLPDGIARHSANSAATFSTGVWQIVVGR